MDVAAVEVELDVVVVVVFVFDEARRAKIL